MFNESKKNIFKNYNFDENIQNICLYEIEKILLSNNRSLKMYPEFNFFEPKVINDCLKEELDYSTQSQKTKMQNNYSSLTTEQKKAFGDTINATKTIKSKSKLFLINGFGGSGKTYFYNTLLPKILSEGKIAIAIASSGIASLLMEGGRTAHFKLKIPLKCNGQSTCDIKPDSNIGKLVRSAKLFIWDEAPMLDRNVYETVDRTFRDIMKQENPDAAKISYIWRRFSLNLTYYKTRKSVKNSF